MRFLGQIVVWGSLAGGVLAASTAYLVSLDLEKDRLAGLTLAAPAGETVLPDGSTLPVAAKDQPVTAELVTELRRAGVDDILVKEFAFQRWRGKWYFLLSAAGLLLGAWLVRRSARPARTARAGPSPADAPDRILENIRTAVEHLRSRLPGIPDDAARLKAVVEQVGELQKTDMPNFVAARPALTSRLGLAGYAAMMDSFAAAERQLNRAWSASVDGFYEEAAACVDEASVLLDDASQKLSEGGGTKVAP